VPKKRRRSEVLALLRGTAICAILLAAPLGVVHAQEQEAVLQNISVPGASFDLILATPRVPAALIDLGRSPEAFVVHLAGHDLVLVFETGEQMLTALDGLRFPIGAFSSEHNSSVAAYFLPKAIESVR
jgi:hypothetical protein